MAWSNDTVLEFVQLYKNEQLIWDPKHISHRNRNEVNDAWERITNNMSIDCSVVDLKKKKESLMTAFRSHFNKKRRCPSYRPSWFAYSLMESFLGKKYSECDSTQSHQGDTEFYDTSSYNTSQASDPLQTTGTTLTQSPERQNNVRLCRPPPRQNTTQKRPSQGYLQTKNETDEKSHSFIFPDKQDDRDECDLYCQLLAKKLKRLDEHQRDVVMHEIDNLLFRAKMESSQVNYTASPSPDPRLIKSPIFIVSSNTNNQFDDENTSKHEHTSP